MYVQRTISDLMLRAWKHSPVILLQGARQTGKSTLIRHLIAARKVAKYATLDDLATFSAVKNDPVGFLQGAGEHLAIDEVQRVPELFLAIKHMVDEKRRPGKYLLTGSANVMLLPKIADSLTGRMDVFTLYPFAVSELHKKQRSIIDMFFAPGMPFTNVNKRMNLNQLLTTGGFPEMLRRKEGPLRRQWFSSYLAGIINRDMRDISNISGLSDMPKLIRIIASRVGSLANFSEYGRTAGIPETTFRRYLSLFVNTFLISLLQPYSGNLSSRLVKSPKLYFNDTALLCYLLGTDAASCEKTPFYGALVANFVYSEILKHLSWSKSAVSCYFYRTAKGVEVDFVLERSDQKIVGIEIKAGHTPTSKMFNNLRTLRTTYPDQFHRGILLYHGTDVIPFDKDLFAVPISAVV